MAYIASCWPSRVRTGRTDSNWPRPSIDADDGGDERWKPLLWLQSVDNDSRTSVGGNERVQWMTFQNSWVSLANAFPAHGNSRQHFNYYFRSFHIRYLLLHTLERECFRQSWFGRFNSIAACDSWESSHSWRKKTKHAEQGVFIGAVGSKWDQVRIIVFRSKWDHLAKERHRGKERKVEQKPSTQSSTIYTRTHSGKEKRRALIGYPPLYGTVVREGGADFNRSANRSAPLGNVSYYCCWWWWRDGVTGRWQFATQILTINVVGGINLTPMSLSQRHPGIDVN